MAVLLPSRAVARLRPGWQAGLGIALAACAVGSGARADAEGVTLAWTAPAECPDRARVLAKIDRLAPASARLRVRVDATVTRDERGYRVALVTEADGARGERALEAATCASLADATAVIVAMMLDPASAAAGQASAPVASVAASPPPSESSEAPPVPEAPAPDRRVAGVLMAGGALDSGLGPGTKVGVMVGGGVTIDRLRLDVVGSSFAGRAGRVEAAPDAGGDVTVRSLLARGCVTPSHAMIVASYACAVAGAAQVSASGFGVEAPSSGSASFAVVGASGLTALRLTSSVSLELGAEALVPLARPRFVLERVGEAHRVAPVALGLRAALGVAF